jgi:hypothetical protein
VAWAETEVREQIARALAGSASLSDLQQWLIDSTWDDVDDKALAAADPARSLAFKAQLALAEWERGDRTDEELRSTLERLAFTVTAVLGDPLIGHGVITGSDAVTESAGEDQALFAAGTRSAAARA